MIAYNNQWLDNLHIQRQVSNACSKGYVTIEEVKACEEKYPVKFYTPNFLIRIGLFLLTVVITIFSLGLFALISSGNLASLTGLLIFFALLSYGVLEFIVRSQHHFRSGVDDALIWMTLVFIVLGFNISSDISSLENAALVFIVTIYLSLRFAHIIMSAIACIAFLALIFFGYTKLGETGKATVSFVIMTASALLYFFASKQRPMEKWKHYADCLLVTAIVSLFCFYAAGNYYVVREASISMFHMDLKENEGIPFGWLFWIFTVIIPFIYLGRGIQKKDAVLIRVGLILIAAVVLTVRYYYHILPIETAMIAGGVAMIAGAYALIKYLISPKHGFTDEKTGDAPLNTASQLESLAIAQTFGQGQVDAGSGTTFGGGSGGGGGAGGEF